MSWLLTQSYRAKRAGEIGTIRKAFAGEPTVALVYPNIYHMGMSNLGFQSLYGLINADPRAACERAFLPDPDELAIYRRQHLALKTIESERNVRDCDAVAISTSFENDYLNFLPILELAKIPLLAHERNQRDPIVIAGGAAITINPQPILPFVDLIFVGEAEEAIPEILEILRSPGTRREKIDALGRVEGIYPGNEAPAHPLLPALGDIIPRTLPGPKGERDFCPRTSLAQIRAWKRRVPASLDDHDIESIVLTHDCEFGSMFLVEVQRGCGRGCKFCAEGFIYTPFREKSFEHLQRQIDRGLKHRPRIGLIGADLLAYPNFTELCEYIHANGGGFSPASVRVDGLSEPIVKLLAGSGHKTIALGIEAGSDRLRFKIGKRFTNEVILEVASRLVSHGIRNLKLYCMIGYPDETTEDVVAMASLAQEVRAQMNRFRKPGDPIGQLILSLNPLIPKPRTPYQGKEFVGIKTLKEKIKLVSSCLKTGGVVLGYESPFLAYVQTLLSNGTTDIARLLWLTHRYDGDIKRALRAFPHSDWQTLIQQAA